MAIQTKVVGVLAVLLLGPMAGCAVMPEPGDWNSYAESKAQARFEELCRTQASVHIYKTVENVDGFLWVSPWPELDRLWSPEHIRQLRDQYGLPSPADYCDVCLPPPAAPLIGPPKTGYAFVEVSYPNGELSRHEGPLVQNSLAFSITPIQKPQSRYAVTFENIGNSSDRALWIGGSRQRITDLYTGEVLAERVSFSRGNPGLLRLRNRGPWGYQVNCARDPLLPVSLIIKVLHSSKNPP